MAFNGTLTLNNTTSPEGVSNAFSFLVNANANGGLAIQTITTSAQSYTFSAYLKGSVNGQKVRLFGDLNSTIEDFTLTTDWVRYTKTFTGAVGGQSIYLLNGAYMSPAQNNLYYGYGMQMEVSSYATSLIPSNGSSATRVADGPLNLSTTQTLTNFTLFWDGLIFDNGDTMFFGSGDSAWYLDINASINRVVLDLASGRKYRATSASLTPNQRFKLAVKRSGGVTDVFVNGTKLTPTIQVTDTTSLTLSSITWGFSSTYYPKMKVNEICAFQVALTDAECQSLTTI
jgi:hypothetical protein